MGGSVTEVAEDLNGHNTNLSVDALLLPSLKQGTPQTAGTGCMGHMRSKGSSFSASYP